VRNAFVRALTRIAAADSRVVFLTGDLGYKLFDDFAARFPGRFVNAGVAEGNMVGVASGLALEGKRPIVYSIVPFVTLRCYEQIRNDVCYNRVPVILVGVGGGWSYGANGPTHHGMEDVAVMRLLPGMTVVCPGDPHETEAAVEALAAHDGPAYLRLGRAGEPAVHPGPVRFRIGEALVLREGGDVALLSTGNMLATAVATADILARGGVRARVVSVPTVKPLPLEAVDDAADHTRAVVTLEEHSVIGGFGAAVAEHLAERSARVSFRRFGAPDTFAATCGDQAYYREESGLTPARIAAEVTTLLGAQT
jgi:transketolase